METHVADWCVTKFCPGPGITDDLTLLDHLLVTDLQISCQVHLLLSLLAHGLCRPLGSVQLVRSRGQDPAAATRRTRCCRVFSIVSNVPGAAVCCQSQMGRHGAFNGDPGKSALVTPSLVLVGGPARTKAATACTVNFPLRSRSGLHFFGALVIKACTISGGRSACATHNDLHFRMSYMNSIQRAQ